MTSILGISAFYHDSAAALIVDGEIVAAAQEERFSRLKHDYRFPVQAVNYCLKQAGLSAAQLDHVGFYDKPLTKFERLMETYASFTPSGYRSFRKAMPLWIKQKLHLRREIKRGLNGEYRKRIVFTDHHESHAASAFFPSPFNEAAILTIDGVGEWSTTCFGVGHGNRIELKNQIRFPHSLGLLYSAFTYYTGFRVNSGEYKLMGLAPYGEPVYRDLILEQLLDLKPDGSFHLDMQYFNYCQGLTMTSERFHQLFGGPPRDSESEITQREMDLAASIQSVTEEIVMRLAEFAFQQTKLPNLVLAGGVALNCVANGNLLRDGPFQNIWIQPAAGDAGGALGNAMFIWHQLLNKPREVKANDQQRGSLLGPEFTDAEVRDALDQAGLKYQTVASDDQLCVDVAEALGNELVVGWFQGRMEFGPRALGNRSILGDARSPEMQSKMNLKIKYRESFRPFAPLVLSEKTTEYFDLPADHDSPYMLIVAPVAEDKRLKEDHKMAAAFGIEKLNIPRSSIPAVTHVDYSARVQTVDKTRNVLLRKLLDQFYQQTDCPVLINTSFNVRSEPIVCTPEDAIRCFLMTEMDVLAIGKQIVFKDQQDQETTSKERREHLLQFELD